MQTIQSRDNERVKAVVRLCKSAAAREEEGLFFAEGLRLCRDLAETMPAAAVFASEAVFSAFPQLAALAGEENTFLVNEGVAQKLAQTKTPQGLFCLFALPKHGLDALDTANGVLLCEAVADPANVGAVIRSAAALGFGGVVLSGECADAFGPKALRASMGAVGRVPVVQGVPLQVAAVFLRDAGLTLYAASLQNARAVPQFVPKTPFGLLIGNEGAGLSEAALALADGAVCIKMHAGVESMNAAAAAAVLMYALKNGRAE